ncbi:MAG TPA: NAD(+) kinase, partial [Clostridiales bacterium]|nr:NAD(+) kinase [Clostridiales bacterium]
LKITVGNDEYFALNDAVIERDKAAEENTVISKINLSIGGQSVYDLSADGIIISTPTGST